MLKAVFLGILVVIGFLLFASFFIKDEWFVSKLKYIQIGFFVAGIVVYFVSKKF